MAVVVVVAVAVAKNILAYSQTNHISAWEGGSAAAAPFWGKKRGTGETATQQQRPLSFILLLLLLSSSNCQTTPSLSLSLLCKLMTALGQWERQNLSPFDR